MLAAEQTVTIGATPFSLRLTGRDMDRSEYHLLGADGTNVHLEIKQAPETKNGRRRFSVRLQKEELVANALESGTNVPVSYSTTFTADFPATGVLPVKVSDLCVALQTWLLAASVTTFLVNGET